MEVLISARVAREAKKRGFSDRCSRYYKEQVPNRFCIYGSIAEWNWNDVINDYISKYYSAPTQAILQRWIREELKISIKIDDYFSDGVIKYDYSICALGAQEENPRGRSDTYEMALEKALYNALVTKTF